LIVKTAAAEDDDETATAVLIRKYAWPRPGSDTSKEERVEGNGTFGSGYRVKKRDSVPVRGVPVGSWLCCVQSIRWADRFLI
jgi:hypothetical protein